MTGTLLDYLALLAVVLQIVLLLAMWMELRQLKRLLHQFISSSRENMLSVTAAINEAGALLSRTSRPESTRKK